MGTSETDRDNPIKARPTMTSDSIIQSRKNRTYGFMADEKSNRSWVSPGAEIQTRAKHNGRSQAGGDNPMSPDTSITQLVWGGFSNEGARQRTCRVDHGQAEKHPVRNSQGQLGTAQNNRLGT